MLDGFFPFCFGNTGTKQDETHVYFISLTVDVLQDVKTEFGFNDFGYSAGFQAERGFREFRGQVVLGLVTEFPTFGCRSRVFRVKHGQRVERLFSFEDIFTEFSQPVADTFFLDVTDSRFYHDLLNFVFVWNFGKTVFIEFPVEIPDFRGGYPHVVHDLRLHLLGDYLLAERGTHLVFDVIV